MQQSLYQRIIKGKAEFEQSANI